MMSNLDINRIWRGKHIQDSTDIKDSITTDRTYVDDETIRGIKSEEPGNIDSSSPVKIGPLVKEKTLLVNRILAPFYLAIIGLLLFIPSILLWVSEPFKSLSIVTDIGLLVILLYSIGVVYRKIAEVE